MAVTFKPPADRYDPSLDAQLAASGRGFGDLTVDAGIANQRDLQDYGFARNDLTQAQARGHEDIGNQRFDVNRGFDRGVADIGTHRHDIHEDYQRNVGLLQRQFRLLGANQGGQFRAAGISGGGAALQAARKRAENQQIERQPLDTGFERANRDLQTQETRMGEDRGTSLDRLGLADTRLNQDTESGLGRLGVGLQRGVDDRSLALLRGGREQTFFGLDTATAKAAQAAATGWDPGARPSNEFVGPQGPYRTIVQGNRTLGIGPGGDVLFRRPRRRP
jgi:hypothetical protein